MSFRNRWTIILGPNGSGKTTLLQLLALVADFDIEQMAKSVGQPSNLPPGSDPITVGFVPFFNVAVINGGFRPKAIEDAHAGVFRPEHNIKAEVGVLIDCHGLPGHHDHKPHAATVSCEWKLQSEEGGGQPVTGSNTGVLPQGMHPRVFCVAYGAWRRRGQVKMASPSPANPFESRIHLFNEMANLIDAEEWFLRLEFAAGKGKDARKPIFRSMFAQVKAALTTLLPNVSDIRTSISSGRQVQPVVEFKTDFGWLQLSQLSYGYQTLVAWVVDFAARMFEEYPDSENPLSEPAICLVDELDLHLHPSWQREVMQYLSTMFPKTQFVATVHSPLIVQAAPEVGANVVVLRKKGDYVEIVNDPLDVKGWRADQILASELFNEVPVRAGESQAVVDERKQLLSKATLTASEKKRVKELEEIVDSFPLGSSKDRDQGDTASFVISRHSSCSA